METIHIHSIPKADAWCNDTDSDGIITLHLPDASAKRERIRNLKERLLGEHQEAAESVVKLDSKDNVENVENTCTTSFGHIILETHRPILSGLLDAAFGM